MSAQHSGTGTPSLPSVAENPSTPIQATHPNNADLSPPSSAASSGSEDDSQARSSRPQRPKIGSRKSSGTIIVPRDSPNIELQDEVYDEDDARTMSPRRSIEEIEQMGRNARQSLMEQAKALQQSLSDIVDRVELIRTEHEKLEGGNKFLQSYIGELMQTSKITSTGAAKAKGKGRSSK